MKVVNLKDAIILSSLKNGLKSRREIEKSLGVQKTITARSLTFLNNSGLIAKRNIQGNEFFALTTDGEKAIEGVFRQVGPKLK